jgi:UTP:GlnB (protein PII) uridylyltransferase
MQSRRALYVAMLVHDIAKGRGGDHSELGADVALQVGPALGLSAEETEMVSWLVLHHLLLSQTAFKRDIDDPKTILDLAETIPSPESLRLLLVLTVADMRAVSAKVWNGWKATLLRELYWRVAEVLAGGLSVPERDVRVARANEVTDLIIVHEHRGEPDGLVVCHLPFGPTAYFGLMNCVARHDIKDTALGTVSEAYPHLILEARARAARCCSAVAGRKLTLHP